MRVDVLCGEEHMGMDIPADAVLLNPKTVQALADPEASVRKVLEQPVGSKPLAEMAAGRRDACVVISDVTRPVPNKVILPPILETLEQAGLARERITILIATGMHRPNEGRELEGMVGTEIMTRYRIVNHFCRRAEDLEQVGVIDGAAIEINKHYLNADLKILTGLIEPHMYAGYSGGRKAILPGIASYETMTYMHSYKMIDHPEVTNCKLQGNPFHEAGEKVAALAGVDFILNVVINKERDLAGVFAGHHTKAHEAGCRMVADTAVQELPEPVDLVITSAGGYPLDATFYQVSKGLIAARNILKPGGAIIMLCECREGLGSGEYCELIHEGRSAEDFAAHCSLPDNFVIDQWCLQTTYQAISHAADIYVYSPYLTQADLGALGMTKIDDVQTIVDKLCATHPRVAVSPEGPYVVGLVK